MTSSILNLRESWRLVSFKSSLRHLIQSPHVLRKSGYSSLETGFLACKVKWQLGNATLRGRLPRAGPVRGRLHGRAAEPLLRQDLRAATRQDRYSGGSAAGQIQRHRFEGGRGELGKNPREGDARPGAPARTLPRPQALCQCADGHQRNQEVLSRRARMPEAS